MPTIDISSDIEAAMTGVDNFWRQQIPFATSRALNSSIFDVRRHIVQITYPKAFEVRNPRFANVLFRVVQRAKKGDLEAVLGQALDRDNMGRHVTGGVKRGRAGGRVAIPAQPAKMRSKNGRIRKPMKPGALDGKRGVFAINKGGRKLIFRRGRNEIELLYTIVPSANIKKTFRYYEDAEKVALRVFPGHWSSSMNAAIRSSRFFPG